jgi:hypothetical protein
MHLGGFMFTLIIMALVAIVAAVAAVAIAGKVTLTKLGFGSFQELASFVGTTQWVVTQKMIDENHRFQQEWQEHRALAILAQNARAEAQAKVNTLTQ